MTKPDSREHRRAGTGPTENSAKPRRRLWGPALVAAGVCAAAGLGLWLQIGERLALDERHVVGSVAPDRVDVDASVQRVDAASRELTLRVTVVPRGRLADPDGLSPAGDLVVRTSAAVRGGRNGDRGTTRAL
ncbi:DUF4436 family protein [Embleya sp. NPDC020886]|uniref:DUF4436 family protein n=1 Tax=Embleya sp. NPDC020886 TaxID=3363980 RepID=UPI0037BD49CC